MLFILMFLSLLQVHVNSETFSSNKCVYQSDTDDFNVKITCSQGAVLHIMDQYGNILLTGETGNSYGSPMTLHVNT